MLTYKEKWLKIPTYAIWVIRMRVIVYRRVSTGAQTLESQNVTLKRYISQNNLTVVREYVDEAKPGDDKSRTQYKEMLAHLYDTDYEGLLVLMMTD